MIEIVQKYFEVVPHSLEEIKSLKRLIINLAIKGKLNKSNNTENATDLLKQIRSEKEVLKKEKKKKKETFLGITDELYDIPNNWIWTRLGEITSYIQRGKKPIYSEAKGPLVISQKCVQWNGLNLSVAKYISEESLKNYEEIRFLRNGDLLWNSTGTGTIGRVIKVKETIPNLVCDSHVTVVRCLIVNPDFVRMWLMSDYVYGEIENNATGTTNQIELSKTMAMQQIIPLPPLQEQSEIVQRVDYLFLLLNKLEQKSIERELIHKDLLKSIIAELTHK